MDHISAYSDEVKQRIARMRERSEDPEFQRQSERLAIENEAYAKQQAEADRNRRLLVAGVPLSVWAGLNDPRNTTAVEAVRLFLVGPRESVFLTLAGPAGRGKTFAAAYAVDREGGRYVTASDLVSAGTFGEGAELWRDLETCRIAAIDELGSEYRNAAFEANLYALLNRRHANLRRTVLATNLDAQTFAARYCPNPGDPLRDRLATAGTWVNLPGESMRRIVSGAERSMPREPGEEG